MTLALDVMEMGLPSGTAHALLAIAVSADPESHEVTITAARLAQLTGSSVRVTRDRLGALKRSGLLVVLGRSRYRVEVPKGKGAESARYESKGAESARYEGAKGAESARSSRARALHCSPSIEGDRETRASDGGLSEILRAWSSVCGRIAHNGYELGIIKAALAKHGEEIVKEAIGRIAAWYESAGRPDRSSRRARASWIDDRCVDIQNERADKRKLEESKRDAVARDADRFREPEEWSDMERAQALRELRQVTGEVSVG